MFLYIVIISLIWFFGAFATYYSALRWLDVDALGSSLFWPISIPIFLVVFIFLLSIETTKKLAQKDKSKRQ